MQTNNVVTLLMYYIVHWCLRIQSEVPFSGPATHYGSEGDNN
jgi:hypothetical protein